MKFWDKITGNDITKIFGDFEARVLRLPLDYQQLWEKIKQNLWGYSDFTGRNLMPILDSALTMLEETAGNGQRAQEVLGEDIETFCEALAGEAGANSFRGKWRKQLNHNIAKKLGE